MDLESLLSALQSTQQAKTTAKLSERNVVELVAKLKQLGILGDDLLYTINGKEYITTDRLKADIQAALVQAGGRLELVELPALVGVDLNHCEKQVDRIIQESGGGILLAQDELISIDYFDCLAAEVDDLLHETGLIRLSDLALQYNLNTELLMSVITARMGTGIKGRLENGLLYTPAYIRHIKAQLRGALRGASTPLGVAQVLKEAGLDMWATSTTMMHTLVEDLVQEGVVKGTLKPGGSQWVPSVFTNTQQSAVRSFYEQNGWLAYDTVKKMGIGNERSYLKSCFPDGLALSSVFVSPVVVSHVEAMVEEAIQLGSWADVGPVLPSVLSPADTALLLQQCPSLSGSSPAGASSRRGSAGGSDVPLLLAGTCVVSPKLLKALQEVVETEARKSAEVALTEKKKQTHAAKGGTQKQAGNVGGAKGGGRDASRGVADEEDDEEEEDWSMGGGKKGKKGRGGKGGSKGGKTQSRAAGGAKSKTTAGGANSPLPSSSSVEALPPRHLAEVILDKHPDMEGTGDTGGLAMNLARHLRPAGVKVYESHLEAALTATAETRKKLKESALRSLEECWVRAQLCSAGADSFKSKGENEDGGGGTVPGGDEPYWTLTRQVVRTVGAEAIDWLIRWFSVDYLDEVEEEVAGTNPVLPLYTAGERQQVLRTLPTEVAEPLQGLVDSLNKSEGGPLLCAVEKVAGDLGIRLRRLDKKSERAALQQQEGQLREVLARQEDPGAALTVVVPLVVLTSRGCLVNVPGRAISGVLVSIKPEVDEKVLMMLERFHQLVVAHLTGQVEGLAGSAEEVAEKLHSVMAEAKELLQTA